jgi:hypothetical protein
MTPSSLGASLQIVELGTDKSLKWSSVQTPHVSIALTIETLERPLLTSSLKRTPFASAAAVEPTRINGGTPRLTFKALMSQFMKRRR